jgi:DNA recombination protein RmuC
LRLLEQSRQSAYGGLDQHLKSLADSQHRLQQETGNLVKALRAPAIRGQWGELTLKRVAELAGMVDHCDFVEQLSVTGDDGRLRPDMVVQLPGGRQIIVDAKPFCRPISTPMRRRMRRNRPKPCAAMPPRLKVGWMSCR